MAAVEPLNRLVNHLRRKCGVIASDGELLAQFARLRDEAAFAELVRRHGGLVMGIARRHLPDRQSAEDVVQATFLALARNAARLGQSASLVNWLYTVAVRQSRTARARFARQHNLRPRLPIPAAASDPLAEVSGRELVAIIDDELARLPERYRLPLVLCALEGLTRDDAAVRLGWTLGTIRGRLERGRELLRTRLAKRGLAVPAVLAGGLLAAPAEALSPGLARAVVRAAVALPPAVGSVKALLSAAVVLAVISVSVGAAILPGGQPSPKNDPPLSPAAAMTGPRLDRYGDPLPDGAVARIGTNRLVTFATVIAFSPDGRLIGAGAEHLVRVWDNANGRLVFERRFETPPNTLNPVTELTFSAESRRLAVSGFWQESIELWDIATAKLLQTIPNTAPNQKKWARTPQGPTLAFTPDGRTLVAGGKDGSLILWDTFAARELARLRATDRVVLSLTMTRDGRTALTAHQGGEMHLWDLADRRHLRRLDVTDALPQTAVLAPDGRSFVVGTAPGEIDLLDLPAAVIQHRLKGPEPIVGQAYAPDGNTLWVARKDGDVSALDVQTGRRRAVPRSGVWLPPALSNQPPGPNAWFSPDGRSVAWNDLGSVREWDLTTGRETPALAGHRRNVLWVGFTADGRGLLTGSNGGEVGVWDAATGLERRPIRVLVPNQALNFSRYALSTDRRRLALLTTPKPFSARGFIHIWDPAGDRPPTSTEDRTGQATCVGWTADGQSVVAAEFGNQIGIYEAATGRLVRRFPGRQLEQRLRLTPDGSTMATNTGGRPLTVRLYDFVTGQVRGDLAVSTFPSCLAVSPDGRFLACGTNNDFASPQPDPRIANGPHLIIWDIGTGRELVSVGVGQSDPTDLAFSPDGRLIVMGMDDGKLRLWEVASGQERRRFAGHELSIWSVDFAPDGRRIASGSRDCTAVVWQVYSPGPVDSTEADLETRWAALAGDGVTAHHAMGVLIGSRDAVQFLAKRLPPAATVGDDRLAALVAELDSPRFTVREAATMELARLADRAAPALKRTLSGKPSGEVRERAEKLLKAIELPITNDTRLRELRAVEVLEQIHTLAAHELLKVLAAGARGATLTRAAAEAIKRLELVQAGR